MTNKINLLAFAAHPDDVEISSSGTMIKHQRKGYSTGIIDLTRGELGTRGTPEIRQQESDEATKILKLSVRENLDLGDGFFQYNQENLIKIIEKIRTYTPDIILINAPSDRHPDHGRAAKLLSDACFYSGLLKIDTNQAPYRPKAVYHYMQDYYLKPDFVVDISEVWDEKMKALMCFKSQFYSTDSSEPTTPISTLEFLEFLKGRFLELGRPIGAKYAEGFIACRTVGVDNIFDLI
ncbi:MAG: bacillithiol biosynthesis deacetylase BshB1 [Bacteroidetes bacterium]|nr:bacillithiol biosynthesis deacetylase BshB1 [Bacteroidota bacterium]